MKISDEEGREYSVNIGFGIFFLTLFLGLMVASIYHGLALRSWLVHWLMGMIAGGFGASFLVKARKLKKSS